MSGRYLAPEETMDPALRDELVLAKLRRQVEYVWERSPFYRRLWGDAGVNPEMLQTLADLRRFPLVTKDAIRRDQAETPPFGSNLCCDPADVSRIHGTSGTTGRPVLFAVSREDWIRIGATHGRIMWSFGIRPGDSVFLASYFSLYMGSWGALAGAEALGATVFPYGAGVPGQTERALVYLEFVRPTVFYGTPSYALHLANVAEAHDVDPRQLGFRIMFFSGEAGAGIATTKARIESTFGALCVDTGSMAEMTPWMTNAECDERTGMHLWDDIVYTEIVDRETLEPIGGDGEGVPVYTHLERSSQPMIRLLSGDLTRVTSEPCPCGRTYRRLPEGIYGRIDDMLVLRGANVYPHVIENVLRGVPGLGSEYRLIVERPDELDLLTIECEAPDAGVASAVAERVQRAIGLRAAVTIHPVGTLPTTEFKARRVIDRRAAEPAGA
ncbi:MAG: AMP-binding protein [Actinomycetota bacterium]